MKIIACEGTFEDVAHKAKISIQLELADPCMPFTLPYLTSRLSENIYRLVYLELEKIEELRALEAGMDVTMIYECAENGRPNAVLDEGGKG